MKVWFENLQQQEKRAVIGAAALLGVMLVYLVLWKPLTSGYDELKKSTIKYELLVLWMQEKAAEVKQLKASSGSNIQRGNQSILGVVDKTSKQLQLADMVKQVRPDGENKVRVRLENAPFDKLLRWLEVLQQTQGIQLVSSSIEKQEETGLVNARLVFEDASQ